MATASNLATVMMKARVDEDLSVGPIAKVWAQSNGVLLALLPFHSADRHAPNAGAQSRRNTRSATVKVLGPDAAPRRFFFR